MLAGGIAITFTALLYSRHIRRYPELMPWKVDSCGKVEISAKCIPFICKYFAPLFNIVSACLSHKHKSTCI